MGNSASTSNTEKILAVASPFSNAEGEHSGQVNACELNDDTNACNKTLAIFSGGGNQLGSSAHVCAHSTCLLMILC